MCWPIFTLYNLHFIVQLCEESICFGEMWRQNLFLGNCDSDQSISDDEDASVDLGENRVSFAGNAQKEEGCQVQSKLEILRGTDDLSSERKIGCSTHKKEENLFVEDDVEMPDFPNENRIFSPRKASQCNAIDNEEYFIGTKLHRDEACTWSLVSKEAEALVHLNENALSSVSGYSKANKSCKGIKSKTKPKISFHFQPQGAGVSRPCIAKNENVPSSKVLDVPELSEPKTHTVVEPPSSELHEDIEGENENQSEIVPARKDVVADGFYAHSMAEILAGLQDKSFLLRETSKMRSRKGGKKVQLVEKRGARTLGERTFKNEDPLMASGSSGDDEANCQSLKPANPGIGGQTAVDRFQEALAATSVGNEGVVPLAPKTSGIGLFRKLQEVMQSEKDRDAEFMKKLQLGACPTDEPHSIVVEILARYLDAKLTVCRCCIYKNPEGCQIMVDGGRTRTVIFSPRVCSDVDLEVGNLICIHQPWKEVDIFCSKDTVILSAYFSQIAT